MFKTTELYNQAMISKCRGKMDVLVRCGAIDMDAAETVSQISATHPEFYSENRTFLYENGIPDSTYITCEPARFIIGAKQVIPARTNTLAQGYVSQCLSNANGEYIEKPYIDIAFSKTHTAPGLTLAFDARRGEYAHEIIIQVFRDETTLVNELALPDGAEWIFSRKLQRFNRIRITFIKSCVPFRRARLQQIKFGIGFLLTSTDIISLNQMHECDPLSRRLPQHTLKVSADNTSGIYDPDHPATFSDLIEKRTPISVDYKLSSVTGLRWRDLKTQKFHQLELSTWRQIRHGGYRMYVDGGKYFLTATPTAADAKVLFDATGPLGFMTQQYKKGRLIECNFYDLALEVFRAYEVPLLDDGREAIKLWDGLKSIFTAAPLPKESGGNLMQLIANAACCAIFTDRQGYLCIEPAPTQQLAERLDFSTQFAGQTVEKGVAVRSVASKYFKYAADGDVVELFNSSFNVSGTSTLFLDFSGASTDITVSVIGAQFTYKAFVYGIEITLTGKGDADILVTGKALKRTSTSLYIPLDNEDESGEVEECDNPLVTSSAMARKVGKWTAEYVAERNAYLFDYRGNPAIDLLDNVYTQSRYSPDFSAKIVRHEINYDGTITGSAVLKRR